MPEHRLHRTGRAPFCFVGTLVAAETSRILTRVSDIGQKLRWHGLFVYSRETGGYVAQVIYHTQWRGELEHFTVGVFPDAAALESALEKYDPVKYVIGYPVGPAYDERQRRLLLDLRLRYETLVSTVLSHSEFVNV